jgi:hypothetical protein
MLDTEVKALAEEATGAEDMNEFIESLGKRPCTHAFDEVRIR